MKLIHRINVLLAGFVNFRNPVTPYYHDKRDYLWYNRGRNLSNRLTFHFFEWRQQWPN
jgi:hypothetical protein